MLLDTVCRARIRYTGLAAESRYDLRVAPLSNSRQEALSITVTENPPAEVTIAREAGGPIHRLVLSAAHEALDIRVDARVETRVPWVAASDAANAVAAGDWDFYARDDIRRDFGALLAPTRLAPGGEDAARIAAAARGQSGGSPGEFVQALVRMLNGLLGRGRNGIEGPTPITWFLEDRLGLGQYLAHTMLVACRSVGIPCRYVSGYRFGADERDEPPRARGLHSWVECLVALGGSEPAWCGFDPMYGCEAGETYVAAHWGRDYHDVRPISGDYRGPAGVEIETDAWIVEAAA